MNKRPAVILDRDGTLIVDKIYLNDPDQIVYLPGVFSAMRLLRDHGFVFCVATNQSGVPRDSSTFAIWMRFTVASKRSSAPKAWTFCRFTRRRT